MMFFLKIFWSFMGLTKNSIGYSFLVGGIDWGSLLDIWNLVLLCLMRCIWREHNRQTFKDVDSSRVQLLASFSGSLFNWSQVWGLTSSDSFPMFFSILLSCI